MKKTLVLLLALPTLAVAQIPPGYYNSAQGLTGNNLKIALHNIIKNHTQITYSGLWSAFPKTDKKANGKVWDIYSNVASGTPPYEYTFVTNQCGNYSAEGDCYNREHSWPQSWFNSSTGPVSDLFHIYPTDGKVNGERADYPYGNVSSPTWTSMNGSKLGPCTNAGYNLTVFEPINEYKGDVARGYFYMTTRYYSEDAGWSTSGATNKADILPWQLNVLLQWHHQDPVSAKEIARNDSIYYKIQNNRNPFIDHPAYADSIWLAATAIFERDAVESSAFSLYANPGSEKVQLVNHSSFNIRGYEVYSITGVLIETGNVNAHSGAIDCNQWAEGVYIITIRGEKGISRLRFIKQ